MKERIHPNRLFAVDLKADEALQLVRQMATDAANMNFEPFMAMYFVRHYNQFNDGMIEIRRTLFQLRRQLRKYMREEHDTVSDSPDIDE